MHFYLYFVGKCISLLCRYWFVVMNEGDEVRDELDAHGYGDNGYDFWHPPDYILESGDTDLQYAYAFFWGISVTMGVGWDIIPGTKVQVAFSSAFIVIGAFMYITLLGTVTTIVANFNAEKTRRINQLESLIFYLKQRMVPKNMFKQVREYYEFMWEGGTGGSESQQQLESLPESMQIQIASEMHKRLLAQIPVFKNLNHKAAFFLVKNWEQKIYVPHDVIVKRIGQDDRLYIVIRGTVRLYLGAADARRKSVIRRAEDAAREVQEDKANEGFFFSELETGNYFGEAAMFSGIVKRNVSAVAITHTELVRIAAALELIPLIHAILSQLYITKDVFTKMVALFKLEGVVEGIMLTYRRRQAVVM